MKKYSEDFEFYINQKKAKENKRMVLHKEAEISFEGQATLINEDKKKSDPNYEIELSNHYILNRSGNYKIIYIDTKQKSHSIYFSIRKKVPIFVFFLLLLPVLLTTLFYHKDLKDILMQEELPIAILKEEKEKDKVPTYTFHMYLNNGNGSNSKKVNLVETIVGEEENRFNKIEPGTKGKFTILIDTYHSTNDLAYEISVKDKTAKPQNLYFKSEKEIEYRSLEELAQKELQGKIKKNSKMDLVIQWEWKYEISDRDNQIDVEDANQIAKYQFEILAIGKEI